MLESLHISWDKYNIDDFRCSRAWEAIKFRHLHIISRLLSIKKLRIQHASRQPNMWIPYSSNKMSENGRDFDSDCGGYRPHAVHSYIPGKPSGWCSLHARDARILAIRDDALSLDRPHGLGSERYLLKTALRLCNWAIFQSWASLVGRPREWLY